VSTWWELDLISVHLNNFCKKRNPSVSVVGDMFSDGYFVSETGVGPATADDNQCSTVELPTLLWIHSINGIGNH